MSISRREFLKESAKGLALVSLRRILPEDDELDSLLTLRKNKIKDTPVELIIEPKLRDQFIWRGNPGLSNVALTFDDGFSQVRNCLSVLKNTETRLTVFPTGQAINADPKVWKEMYDWGCDFGCHTYSHSYIERLSVDEIVGEINRSQNALDIAIGKSAPYRFFRPPGGGMSWNVVEAMKKTGLTGVIWTLSSEGTSKIATPASTYNRVATLSGKGFIVLQHFNYNDVASLEQTILTLRQRKLNPTPLAAVL